IPFKCCVPNCNGNYKNGPKVATFSFPKNEETKRKWLHAICRKDFQPTNNSKVRELHFRLSEIERETSHYVESTGKLLTAPLAHPRLIKEAITASAASTAEAITASAAAAAATSPPERDLAYPASAPAAPAPPPTTNSGPRIRPVEATGLFRRQPRQQHQRGHSPQPPPGSPTLPTPPTTPPAVPHRPQPTAARKVTLQLATWKLERLDIPPPARTRPPRYCLHPWDLRVRRYTSPRYQQAPPPTRQQELSSGSEWETSNPETTNRKSEDINGNYWGPEKKTLTQPSLIYRERVTEKRRTTQWTSTQPPLAYKEHSPSK
ncbi:hypothetical protein ALC62_07762, partial [Cyphomyrmex costatus]